MSSETGKTSEKVGYDTGQQTPVIIKNGDGVSGPADLPVMIYSPIMFFNEVGDPGLTWEVSQSTLKGRISELSITEGMKLVPEDTIQPFPHELAMIRIEYGSAQIVVTESGDPTAADVVMVIESKGVPFNVTKPGMWKEANATLPPISRVVFLAGNKALVEREFTEQEATVCVHFLRYAGV
jgi:hypothetical protein